MRRTVCFVLALAGVLSAQDRVIPPAFRDTEGNQGLLAPFSTVVNSGAVQVLVDPVWVHERVCVLQGLALRADNAPSREDPTPGFSRVFDVALTTVPMTAAAMSNDPEVNRRVGAGTTIVFSGTINVPPTPVTSVRTSPFLARFDFTTPYTYDPAMGGLLIDITPRDGQPTIWIADAVEHDPTQLAGISQVLGRGCGPFSTGISLRGITNDLRPGGNLRLALSAPNAGYPINVAMLGTSLNGPLDLTGLGLTGCVLHFVPIALQVQPPVPWGYTNFDWPLPAVASLTEQTVYGQAVSWGRGGQREIQYGTVSQLVEMVIGRKAPRPPHARCIYEFNGGWVQRVGEHVPVTCLTGVFP